MRGSVPHRARPDHVARHPVHVTLRVGRGVPNLRTQVMMRAFWRAVRAHDRDLGLRIGQYSVQGDHVHLIVEAERREALSRGMQGFCIRVAKRWNAALQRRGRVFADRYHGRAIETPTDMRNTLVYVLRQDAHHGRDGWVSSRVDSCSSAAYFTGWASRPRLRERPAGEGDDDDARAGPVDPPRTWLLREGWRRGGKRGPLGLRERPA